MVTMMDCINRVPGVLKDILDRREGTFAQLEKMYGARAGEMDEIVLIGSGTSNTSSITARYQAEKAAGVRVSVATPNEFLHSMTVRNPRALHVFISQTGTSILTREALNYAKGAGLMNAVLSESANTPAAKDADVFIDMQCGNEEYMMRTIGYSATVLDIVLLGAWLGEKRGSLSAAQRDALLCDAANVAHNIPAVIAKTMTWLDTNRRNMLQADCLIITGSGDLHGVALEGALKVWETPQITSIGFELEEGIHGPNYGYTGRHCVIVLNDGGADNDKARALCSYMKNELSNGFLIGVNALDEHDLAFEPRGGRFACLEFAAAVQVLAYRLAVEQGRALSARSAHGAMDSYFQSHTK